MGEWERKWMKRIWMVMVNLIAICVFWYNNEVGINCFGLLSQNTSHNTCLVSWQSCVAVQIHSITWASTLWNQSGWMSVQLLHLWKWSKLDKLKYLRPYLPLYLMSSNCEIHWWTCIIPSVNRVLVWMPLNRCVNWCNSSEKTYLWNGAQDIFRPKMQTHLSLSEIFIVNKNFDQAPLKTTLDIF